VESGPAGGAVFAAGIAAQHGLDKVLSFDMGGTTAKICLIRNYTPKTARVFEVARSYRFKKGSGMPISIPVIDMVEIGAGGGSLARVDGMQQIRVGPESAGSEPGPACYGRGGVRPAVTDADLILGKLDPDNFAGGSIPLQADAAAFALDQALGQPLGMPTIEAAWGLAEVVDENMANAARVHAVENGEDLSTYTMIAFGGAAPLHAGRLCEKLGVARCLIPQGAGVGSAIGFLRAPFSFESNRTHFMPYAGFDPQAVRALFADMVAEATRFVRTCAPDAPILADFKVYMRYKGQGWEIPVPLTPDQAEQADPAVFLARFEQEYTTLFGRVVAGMAVEITVWSVNAYTATAAVDALPLVTAQPAPTPSGQRQLFDAALGRAQDAGIYDRAALPRGTALQGPALITEEETTTVLPLSRQARILGDGSIDITVQGV
jgi:N-methylhydantoinase A